MSAGDRYLLDTNVISQIRAAGLSASAFVGTDDVAVTETVVDELFFDLPLDDWKIPVLGAILAGLDDPIEVSEALVAQVVELEDRIHSISRRSHRPTRSSPPQLCARLGRSSPVIATSIVSRAYGSSTRMASTHRARL